MKKLKLSIKKKIAQIDAQLAEINANYDTQANFLVQRMGIDLNCPDIDSENYAEFTKWRDQAYAILRLRCGELEKKRAALLLIGYNIARRGKPLHEKTVLKKTQKLGRDGYAIRRAMNHVIFTKDPAQPDCSLYTELKKRGIELMDTNTFRMTLARLDKLYTNMHAHRRTINKYETHLNMFHKLIEYKVSNQNMK